MQFDLSDDAILTAFMIAFGFSSLNTTLAVTFDGDVGFLMKAFPVLMLIAILGMAALAELWTWLRVDAGGGAGGD